MSMGIENLDADCYFFGSFVASIVHFPIWRATTVAQFSEIQGANSYQKFVNALSKPPYRATFASIMGMTVSRASIFAGSDWGKQYMKKRGCGSIETMIVPPLVASTLVQILNTPIIMSTIVLQNPHTPENSVLDFVDNVVKRHGWRGLFAGTGTVLTRTVPKYATVVAINDYLSDVLPGVVASSEWISATGASAHTVSMATSACKGIIAGVTGVVLSNPIDVIHIECVKLGSNNPVAAAGSLFRQHGLQFLGRGIVRNVMLIVFPVSFTIFMGDVMKQWKYA